MAANPFDKYDKPAGNYFDKYDPGAKPANTDGQAVSGFKRSFQEVPGTLAGVGAFAADVVGADGARDSMLAYAKRKSDEVGAAHAGDAQSLTDAWDGKVSWGDFLANAAGYVAGQALQSIVTGGVGALGAKMLANNGIKQIGVKVAAEQIAAGATEEAAKVAAVKAMTEAGSKAAVRGGIAGATAQNMNMELGSIYPDAVEEAGGADKLDNGDRFRVLSASALAAGVDTAGEALTAFKWLKGSTAGGKGILARAAREVPAGMAREAGTEAIQTGIEQYGAAKPLDVREIVDSAGIGAVGGAMAGGGASLRKREAEKQPEPKPGVVDVLGAPDLDAAIVAAKDAVSAKPALGLAGEPDPAALPFEADPRFAGAPVLRNGEGKAPTFGSKQQADIYIGEQALFQSHEPVQTAPGRWEVRMNAATRALMQPNTSIPVGETLEGPPAGEARELSDEERAAYVNQTPLSYRRAMERGLPQPEVTELVPAGEATELEPIPAGEAADVDVETIQPTDLMAKDGQPFVSETGAQARAFASGGGKVVAIPDHFGSGEPGYVVRPLVSARPNNTRGTNARDLPRSSNVNQPDVAGTAGQPVADGAGRPDAAVGGELAAGRVASDATGRKPGTATAVAPGSAGNAPVGAGNAADAALTPGTRVTLNGTPYTVTTVNGSAVKLQGVDGGIKMVARNSKTFGQIQPEAATEPVESTPFPPADAAEIDAARAAWSESRSEANRQRLQRALGKEAPLPPVATGMFDPEAFDRERNTRIKASREAGNTHLDQVPAYVETMRGKDVYGAHDTKVRGRILTVDNNGNVYVEWLDKYSQDKEGATPMKMGKRQVMQSSLGPRDLKDYVAGKPQEPNEAARPQPEAQRAEAAAPAAAPAPAAPAVVPGTGGATDEAGRLKELSSKWKAEPDRIPRPGLKVEQKDSSVLGIPGSAWFLVDEEGRQVSPGFSTKKKADEATAQATQENPEKQRLQDEIIAIANRIGAAKEKAPAPAPEAERTPKAQAVKEALADRKGEWRPSAAEVLKAVTDVTPYGRPYTSTEGQRQKARILKALEGLGLKPREAQSVLDKAMTTEAQRRMPTMRFILNSDVRDAADALGYIRPADAPAKRDEYPLGKTDREDRFFGTRVRVLPELKGDEAWLGTIQMTLNGGRLFSVKRDGSDAGSVRIGGDRLEILSREDAEAKPKEPTKAPASINMLPLAEKWDALVAHTKQDGGDPDKGQRSYRALTQLIGGIEEKPMEVWDRWSTVLGSTGLVDLTGPQVLKWLESNLPSVLDGYIRNLPGASMSSTNAGDARYWQNVAAEMERRTPDHNRHIDKLEKQALDVERLGGSAEKLAEARKTIDGAKRAFNANERTAQQGLASAERREKEQAEQREAAEAAKYKPFDAKELSKKPTPASMSGWFTAAYEGKTVWTQGTILDLSGEPPHLAGYEDRMSPDRNKDGKIDVSRVIPRNKGPEAVPFGYYDGDFGKAKGLVYLEAEGRLVGADATLFRYFTSKFKGATYFSSPDGGVITVQQGANKVGVLMPIKLGSDAQPAPSVAEVRAKIDAKPAAAPAPAPEAAAQPEAEAPAPAAEPAPAEAQADADEEAPQLSEAQARKQFEWRDMGQKDGTKTHRLFFYLKPEDKGTGRAMGRGYVELYEGSSGWRVDGEGESFKALADAKKAAVEAAIPVLREQGWIAPAAPPAEQAAAILNAAAEPPKGKERLDVLKDVKAGAITPEEVAAAYPAATTGTESLNKRHAIAKKQVLTPGGALKADATNSRADSAVWYYQGDMDALRFTASVKVNGEADPRADDAKRMLVQIKAAQDAGWRRANYRAGSLGTVWVFERGDEFLTRAGMENAAAVEVQRPVMPEDGPGWDKMVARQRVLARAFNDWLLTLPEDQQYNRGVVSRKIGETPVGQWAGIGDDPKLGLTLRYFPGPGEREAREVSWTIQTQSRPDWPALRDYIAELAAEAPANDAQASQEPAPAPAAPATPTEADAALWKRITAGEATPDEFKAGFNAWVANKPAILAELNGKTKADLLKTGGAWFASRYKGDTKPEIAEALWRDGASAYTLGRAFQYGMGKDSYTNGIRKMVEATDADQLAQFVADRKAAQEEAMARVAKMAEAIKDPKTLGEYNIWMRATMDGGKTFTEARMMLTPEQRAAYDELAADSTRSSRKVKQDTERTTVRAAGQTTAGEIIATKHTRDGHDLWVVKLADRVSKDDYITLLASAKRLGGNYSSFRGNGAVPGFQFRSPDAAQAFLKLAGGDTAQATEVAQERRNAFEDDRSQSAAERLTEMADRLEERADESLGRDRKANTDRRARFAAAAEAAASADKAMAKTMRNIASAITGGGAKFLDRVRQKVQVELLQTYVANGKDTQLRAKYPTYAEQERHKGEAPTIEAADYAEFPTFTAYRSDLANLGRQLLEVDGTKKLGERIMKVADDVSDAYFEFAKNPHELSRLILTKRKGPDGAGEYASFKTKAAAEAAIARSGHKGKAVAMPYYKGVVHVIMSPSEAMARGIWKGDGDKRITLDPDFAGEMVEKIGRVARRGAKVSVPWQFERAYDRRKQLTRMGIESPAEFRAALREFIAMREQPAEADKIKAMERAMVGRRNDGLDFFPTPEGVADEMVAAADIQPGMRVLEPSAGMGHIAERIRAAGTDPDVIEFSNDRRELLEAKGFNVQGRDFLEFNDANQDTRGFTFGDVFRAPDGTLGVMRSSNGMGGDRVGLDPLDENGKPDPRRMQWHTFSDLEPVEKRGVGSGYDRILMNPPFSDGRDIQHVRHAYDLLKPGGRLVAIMGESAFFNQNKRATEFREWLESVGGTDEKLPEGTFNDPSLPVTTGANARMVVIEKPAGETGPRSIIDGPGADAQFSRGTPSRTGVPMADAKAVIAAIREALPTAPPIQMHDSVRRAPENLRRLIRQAGADNDVEAVYHEGEIHVFPGNIESIERMQFVVAHHEIRHHGLRSMLGPAMGPAMLRMYASNPNLKAAADAKMAAGMADTRILAVEEALADMPVEELQKLTGWARIVAAARQWLRNVAAKLRRAGMNTLADAMEPEGWTDNDIAALVQRAEDVSRGGAAPFSTGGSTVFQRAYHGTPYRGIERFSTDAIGTGEGAQAYGWGLYFASKREVADFYRRKLSGESDRVFTKDGRTIQGPTELAEAYYRPGRIVRGYGGADKVLEFKRTDNGGWAVKVVGVKANGDPMASERPRWHATQPGGNDLRDALEEDGWKFSPAGQLYEVEVPDDNELLLWDKPLAAQSDAVRQRLLAAMDRASEDGEPYAWKTETGEDFYRTLQEREGSDQQASEWLQAAGVKGIKFLDGSSRRVGDGTFNYVIFSGDDAAIMGTAFSRRADQTQTPDSRPQAVRAVQTMPRSPLTGRPVFDLMDAAGNRIETQHHAKTADEALENYRERPARQAAARAAAPAPTYAMPEKAAKAEGSNWRRVRGQEFTSLDEDDAYLYHVTSAPAAAGVREQGLVPNAGGMFGGFYANYSAGKVFLTERSGVSYWQEKVGQQLEAAMDNPPAVTVLRIPKDKIKAKLLPDTVGSGDAGAPAFHSNEAVFSRAGTAKTTAQDLVNSTGGVFDFNRLGETKQDRLRTIMDAGRPGWLGLLTRDQIADVYGQDIAPVKEYDQLTREMENQRSKIAQDADDLYNEWAKLPAETNDKLARLMLDATVYSVHPDGAFTKLGKPNDAERQQVHARLKAQYALMGKEGQAIYGKVRDFHKGTLEQLRDALEARVTRQVENGQAKAAALTKIRQAFDAYLKEGPYFPLSRFGDFIVVGTRESDGERVVASYATAGEQAAAARTLEADGFTVKMKTAKTYSRETDGSAGKFIGDVLTTLSNLDMMDATVGGNVADLKTKLMDDVNQLFIKALPDLSYRKHFMHRKGTPGFSSDMMRGFASSAFHAASHIARLNHGDKMTFALQDAFTAIEQAPSGDFNLHSQVLNELTKRHDAALNPNTHPIAAMLNQVGFVMYLGLSPAAGLINMLQTVMVTMPHLGARYGFGKANASLATAMADITTGAKANAKNGWNAAQSTKLTAAERTMMSELQDEGVIDLTQAHDLSAATGLDTGNVARSKAAFAMARAMKIVGWTFHIPEVMNRQVTALSAYRLEMEKSGNADAAKDAAREAIKRTHFDYSASNRARFMQGNVARVMLQFKQYSQNMTYLLGRAAYQALKGESPEVRSIARRQLVATFGVTWAMAGAIGLPGLGAVAGLIGMFVGAMDDKDEPWDWKVEFRNLLADTFGKEVGEVLSHGIPRALLPWDISNRVSLGDLWFRDGGREGQSPREAFATDAANILGPTAGSVLGLYTAADHMARGNWSKAVENIVPKALRDPLKAIREGGEGVTSYNGEPLMDLTGAEVAGRLLGFAPARASEMYEGKAAVMNAKTAIEEKRQSLIGRMAKARIDKDTDTAAELQPEIAAFNQRNPEFKITGATLAKAIMTRMKNRANTEDGILLPRTKQSLRELGRFAEVE